MALGLTQQLPEDEKHSYSRNYLNDTIAILMGGRIAEELTTGNITTGAGNDLERATELARRMVCEWGMSDAMGPLTFGKKEEQIFLGREIAQHQDYSEDTALKIRRRSEALRDGLLQPRHGDALPHKKALLDIADALLAREVLDAEQVQKLARGEKLEDSTRGRASRPPDETARDRARDTKERPPLVPGISKPLTQE